MAEQNHEILRVEHLKKFFTVPNGMLHAVDDISFTIDAGKTLGVVGESGCGKSTMGRAILRLHEPTDGKVYFDQKDIRALNDKQMKDMRRDMQIIFQDPYSSLNPRMTIGSILEEPLIIHKICKTKEERMQRVLEMLEKVGMRRDHYYRYPHEFSGGQRQRIGIARALSLEPKLIVCDEPISALDVSIQAQVVNLLKRLQQQMGLSYLFITHDLSMVRQISNRIAVMYLGSLVEIADSEDIYIKNRHPYTKALLSAIPIADPTIERERKRILLQGDVPSPVNLPQGCNFCNRCPYATQLCKERKPQLREIEPGHFTACHRAEEM